MMYRRSSFRDEPSNFNNLGPQDYKRHATLLTIDIPDIEIPPELIIALKEQPFPKRIAEKCIYYKRCLDRIKNVKIIRSKDYFDLFEMCLYLELYKSSEDKETLEMRHCKITKVFSEYQFILTVPLLYNHKSAILPEDIVKLYEEAPNQSFIGFVTQVVGNKVTVQLKSPITEIMTKIYTFNIKFSGIDWPLKCWPLRCWSLICWPLRCCHYALKLACNLEEEIFDIIYPQTKEKVLKVNWHSDITWINPNISDNEEQKQAVKMILCKSSRPAPYIIFGPPGTGKTATLIEAICQIVEKSYGNNILVCTSSNAAADDITIKLLRYLPEEIILRMYAPSKDWEEVKDEIRNCTNIRSPCDTNFLTQAKLMQKRIIISTLITSIRLSAVPFRDNYFSYIIIDEASQATEPEILIPITLSMNIDVFNNIEPQIVIAGDHHQLGPIVDHPITKNVLGLSILERLMNNCDVYKKKDGKYDSTYVTKLIKNYRSHKHILYVPNKHFYEGELKCCGRVEDTQIGLKWDMLPNKNFPLIFQEVVDEERMTSSNSVYNMAEVRVVVQYVEMLLKAKLGNYKITENDIGIVTPFKQQQLKIMRSLEEYGWKNISVGTVEMFQGQERLVIILSTVRSKKFTHDGKEHIGFLSNPKRFNVAVTRAKALLILIGNPDILCVDKYWRAIWEYCSKYDAYISYNKWIELHLTQAIREMIHEVVFRLKTMSVSVEN